MKKLSIFLSILLFSNFCIAFDIYNLNTEEEPQKTSFLSHIKSTTSQAFRDGCDMTANLTQKVTKKIVSPICLSLALLNQTVHAITCPQEMFFGNFLDENMHGIVLHNAYQYGGPIYRMSHLFYEEIKGHFGTTFLPLESFQGLCKTIADFDILSVLTNRHYTFDISGSTIMHLTGFSITMISGMPELFCNYTLNHPGYIISFPNSFNTTCIPHQ